MCQRRSGRDRELKGFIFRPLALDLIAFLLPCAAIIVMVLLGRRFTQWSVRGESI